METKNYAKAMASMLTTLPDDITLRWFLLGSGVLLLFAAGLLKLLIPRQEIKFFSFVDPVLLFLNNWQITALAGTVEILASLMLFVEESLSRKFWVLIELTCTLLD